MVEQTQKLPAFLKREVNRHFNYRLTLDVVLSQLNLFSTFRFLFLLRFILILLSFLPQCPLRAL